MYHKQNVFLRLAFIRLILNINKKLLKMISRQVRELKGGTFIPFCLIIWKSVKKFKNFRNAVLVTAHHRGGQG
jgi:hypothetical protein